MTQLHQRKPHGGPKPGFTIDPRFVKKMTPKVAPAEAKKKEQETKKRYSMKVVTEVGSTEHIEWGWKSYERRKGRKGLYRTWDGIIALVSMLQFTMTSYYVAFDPYNVYLLGVQYGLDALLLADICMKVVRNFHLDWRNIELRRGNSALISYLKSWYILDMLSLLPTDVAIKSIEKPILMPLLGYARCNRLFVGFKIFKFLGDLQSEVGASFVFTRSALSISILWMLCHICACVWYMLACPIWSPVRRGINVCIAPSWIYSGLLTLDPQPDLAVTNLVGSFGDAVPSPNVNLYKRFDDTGLGDLFVRPNATVGQLYYYALYWSITTVTAVGLGEVHAITIPEMIFALITQFISMLLLFGIFIGGMISMLTNMDELLFRYKHRIGAIIQYLKDQNQSAEVVRNVTSFYDFLWKRSKGIDCAAAYRELPFALQSDISLEICQQIIARCTLLQGCSQTFLRALSTKFQPMLALPGQLVMPKDEVSDFMVYVQHGELEVLSDDDTDVPVLLLKAGKLFGEVNLITKVPRTCSVRSIGHSDLIILTTDDLLDCLQQFPEMADLLRQRAEERVMCHEYVLPETPAENVPPEKVELLRQRKKQKELATLIDHLKADMGVNLRPLMTALNIDRPQETLKVTDSMELFRIRDPMDEMVEYNMGSFGRRVASRFRRAKQFLSDLSIDPDGLFYYIWERAVFAALLVTFFVNTYVGFFKSYDSLMADPSGVGYAILVVSYLLDVFFILDFAFKFILQIVTAHGKITNHKMMALAYLKSWGCYADLFAILPVELISLVGLRIQAPSVYSTWTLLGYLKVNRALRVMNLPRFFDKLAADLDSNIVTIRAIKFVAYIGIFTQISSVLVFLTACNPIQCADDYRFSWTAAYPIVINDSAPTIYKYSSSLYFAASISSGCGSGDVWPKNLVEQIVANFIMVMGMLVYGYSLASMAATIANTDAQKVVFENRLHSMLKFLEDNKVSQAVIKRAADSYVLLWNVCSGEDIPGAKNMMHDTPQTLMDDIQVDDLIHLVSSIPIFRNIEDRVLKQFASSVKRYLLPPNEFVIQAGDLIEQLFVVRRGMCCMLHPELPNTVVSVLYPGMYFGEIGFLFNRHEIVTVKTMTCCEIFAVSRYEFDEVAQSMHWLNVQMDAMSSSRKYLNALNKVAREAKPFLKGNKELNPVPVDTVRRRHDFKDDFAIMRKGICARIFNSLLMQRTFAMDGQFIQVWEIIRCVVSVVYFILVSLHVGFRILNLGILGVMYFFDLYAWIDIYIKLHIQYANEMRMIVSHPYKTAMRYLRSNFVIDLVAALPFEVTLLAVKVPIRLEVLQWAMYLRLNRLLQIYRVPMLFDYYDNDVRKSWPAIKWIKFLTLFILFNFVMMALPFTVECPPDACAFVPNNCTVNETDHQMLGPKGHMNPYDTSYISPSHFALDSAFECVHNSYLSGEMEEQWKKGGWTFGSLIVPSWYWAASTATSTGLGDITAHPMNFLEQIIFALIMITSKLVFSYVVASIAAGQINAGIKRARFVYKLGAIEQYMDHEQIPHRIQVRIQRYFKLFWLRTKGDNPVEMTEGLPPSLTGDLALQLHKKVIDQLNVFKSSNLAFKKMLALIMKPIFIMEGEYIARAGDINDELFFLYRGTVEVFSKEFPEPIILRSGRLLGERAFMYRQRAASHIRAKENCELYFVHREEIELIFNHFPEAKDELMREADESVNKEMELRKPSTKTRRASVPTNQPVETDLPPLEPTFIDWISKAWNTTFHPESKYLSAWQSFMVILRILSVGLIWYHCGFLDMRRPLVISEYVIEFFFFIDFYVLYRTGFYDETGTLCMEKDQILDRLWKNKLHLWLFLASILPYEMGVFFGHLLLRPWLFAWPRSIRTFPRIVEIHIFFTNWQSQLEANLLVVKALYGAVKLVLITHLFAVIVHQLAMPFGFPLPKSWMSKTILREHNYDPDKHYTIALYLVVNSVTGTGYGDIVSVTPTGRISISFVQIVGKAIFAIIVGDIASSITNRETWRRNFEDRYQALKKWLLDQNTKQSTMERVHNYYNYLWNTNGGIIDIDTMLVDLPPCMRAEMALAVVLFNKASDSLVRVLSSCLRQIQFVPGDYLITQGDIVPQMYFLHRGEAVEVEAGVEISVLRHGRHINWQSLIYDWPASRTVRATDNCEIYVLTRESFELIKENYMNELGDICATMAQKLKDFLAELEKAPESDEEGEEGSDESAESNDIHD